MQWFNLADSFVITLVILGTQKQSVSRVQIQPSFTLNNILCFILVVKASTSDRLAHFDHRMKTNGKRGEKVVSTVRTVTIFLGVLLFEMPEI